MDRRSVRLLSLPEMNKLLRSSKCRATFPQATQLSFGNSELRNATIQADNKLRKYQHGCLVPISRKVDIDLRVAFCLVLRSTRSTSHDAFHPTPPRSGLIVAWVT
jgi:hypothetical protein